MHTLHLIQRVVHSVTHVLHLIARHLGRVPNSGRMRAEWAAIAWAGAPLREGRLDKRRHDVGEQVWRLSITRILSESGQQFGRHFDVKVISQGFDQAKVTSF